MFVGDDDEQRQIDRVDAFAEDRSLSATLPPLRERTGDVEVLAQHFLDEFARETPSLGTKKLAKETIDVLSGYRFPGNVRELKNLVERAAYRDTTSIITPDDLGLLPFDDIRSGGGSFQEKLDALAVGLLSGALRQAEGNQKEAANLLGLKYHQLRYFVKKYGVG